MRHLTFALTTSLLLILTGCPGPLTLRVDVTGVDSATLRTKLVDGDEPTVPTECSTPCDVEIPRGTSHEIRLESPGYYPAEIKVSYEEVYVLGAGMQGDDRILRVPLKQRPAVMGGAEEVQP